MSGLNWQHIHKLEAEVERLKKENKELKEYSKKQDELAERLLAEKKDCMDFIKAMKLEEGLKNWIKRADIIEEKRQENEQRKRL